MTIDDDLHAMQLDAAEEQAAETMASTARLIAQFYRALTDAGLPEPLAQRLTRDWHIARFLDVEYVTADENE